MHISVTLLSSYLYCSRKVFLEKVLKLVEPPKESLVLGTLRHHFYDAANAVEQELVSGITKEWGFSEILASYQAAYQKIIAEIIQKNNAALDLVSITLKDAADHLTPHCISEAHTRAENVNRFIIQHGVYGQKLWEILTPKIQSEIKITSEKLGLTGVIDQLHVYNHGKVPFELKTGRMPQEGVWPGHRIQLVAYALLVEEHFNEPVKEGYVRYLDFHATRPIMINPLMKEEIIGLAKEVRALLTSHQLPDFCENKNKCASCGLRATCHDSQKMAGLMNQYLNRQIQNSIIQSKSI